MEAGTMEIMVNGSAQDLEPGTTLDDLIVRLGLAGQPCAAEVNEQLVPRADHADRVLSPGDRIELVTLVGGG